MKTSETQSYNKKVRKIGNSLGIIFPKEVCDNFKLGEGDVLTFKLIDGEIKIALYDPEYEKLVEITDSIMKERHSLLKLLAKS